MNTKANILNLERDGPVILKRRDVRKDRSRSAIYGRIEQTLRKRSHLRKWQSLSARLSVDHDGYLSVIIIRLLLLHG
jgi:hypothetical protein